MKQDNQLPRSIIDYQVSGNACQEGFEKINQLPHLLIN